MAELSLTNVYGDIRVTLNADIKGTIQEGNMLLSDKYANKTATLASLDLKVDKVTGYALSKNDFTDVLKGKLDNISANAKKVASSTTNGNIQIDDVQTVVYAHPNHSGDIVSTGDGATVIQNTVVTNAKLAHMAEGTLKGRISIDPGAPEDLSPANVRTIITDASNRFLTDTERTNWTAAYTHAGTAHAPSDAPSNATFTGHTGNTTVHIIADERTKWNEAKAHSILTTGNPHSVTKAQVGLTNVDDKSSATIRGEITIANITTPLGYTPVNPASAAFTNHITVAGNITATGQIVWGDTAGIWSRLFHNASVTYGAFTTQTANATILRNEQGTTNQYIFLGDAANNQASTLFGVGIFETTDTAILDLKANGDLLLKGHKVWQADNFKPADYLRNSGPATFTGALTVTTSLSAGSAVITNNMGAASITVTSATRVTNLNAHYVEGHNAATLYNAIISASGSGVITGCEVRQASTISNKIRVASGRVFITNLGHIALTDAEYNVTGAVGEYYTIGVGANGLVTIASDPATYPVLPTNAITLAYLYRVSEGIQDQHIKEARRFTRVYASPDNAFVDILRVNDKERAVSVSPPTYTIARFKEENGRGSLTISDVKTLASLSQSVLIEADRFRFIKTTGVETPVTEQYDVTIDKVINWDNAGGQKHTHYNNVAYTHDGVDKIFMPAEHRPSQNNIYLYKNGLRQKLGTDYTFDSAASSLQFIHAYSVNFLTDTIVVDYIL